jgi:hypothetical protein
MSMDLNKDAGLTTALLNGDEPFATRHFLLRVFVSSCETNGEPCRARNAIVSVSHEDAKTRRGQRIWI